MKPVAYENPYPQGSWEARLETMVQVAAGDIQNPPSNLKDLARIVGKARHEENVKSGLNGSGNFANRNPARSLEMNVLGVYAELMIHHLFWTKRIPFTYSLLVSEKTDPHPDIITPLWTFDVKGIRRDGWDLLANEKIFSTSKATFYVFVKGGRFWIFSHRAIEQWPKKNVAPSGSAGESLAFYRPVKEIDFPEPVADILFI